eukprot:109085_1
MSLSQSEIFALIQAHNNDTITNEDGLRLFIQLCNNEPWRATAHHELAYYAVRLNMLELALKHYQQAYELEPYNTAYLIECITISRECGKHQLVRKYFKQAWNLCNKHNMQKTKPRFCYQLLLEYGQYLWNIRKRKSAQKYFLQSLKFATTPQDRNEACIYLINYCVDYSQYRKSLQWFQLTHTSTYFGYEQYYSALYAYFALEDYSNVELILKRLDKNEFDYDIRYFIEKMRFYIMTKQYKLANQWYLTGHTFLESSEFETGLTVRELALIVKNKAHKNTLEIWYSYLLSCTNRDGLMHLFSNVYRKTNGKGLLQPGPGSSSSHFYALSMATTAMISSAKQSKYYKKWIMSSKRDIYDIGIHFHSRCCVEERFAFGLFQFGVFCYEMKKYQLSYKLINKAYKMCSELPIIKKNWKSLNIELQNMMKELCCDYCR